MYDAEANDVYVWVDGSPVRNFCLTGRSVEMATGPRYSRVVQAGHEQLNNPSFSLTWVVLWTSVSCVFLTGACVDGATRDK